MAAPQRVAVVRATRLGDLLCAVPMLRSLRASWPDAEVTLVGLPWARVLVERYSDLLDDFLEFPGWPGIPERSPDVRRLAAFRGEARERGFDLALQAHGDGRIMNRFVEQLGAKELAGFHRPGEPAPWPRSVAYPTDRPEPLRLLALAAQLGAPEVSPALDFPVNDADRAEAAALRADLAIGDRPYACLHPGSSTSRRRWPAKAFARIADDLVRAGLEVVVTGTRQEARVVQAVRRRAREQTRSAVGRTSLGGLAALLVGARLLVSNDTGVSHLASALGVRSVVVFTASDPARWAPLERERHVVVGDGLPDADREGESRPEGGRQAGALFARVTRPDVAEVLQAVHRQLRPAAGVGA